MSRLFGLVLIVMIAVSGSSRADLFVATLDGASEAPPNASPGFGSAEFEFDLATHTFSMSVTFQDLIGTTTAAHIHMLTATPGTGTAGVATQIPSFISFPLGVTSGTYDHTFDTSLASFYNPTFITNNGGTVALAEVAFAKGLSEGRAYLNIHTTAFAGGEIRGFIQSVPEPGSLALLGVGAAGLLLRRKK